jgi:hypothetical protein
VELYRQVWHNPDKSQGRCSSLTRRGVLICFSIFLLGGCGLLQHEEDVDVIKVAQGLLAAQKDQYGDPLPEHLPIRINYTVTRKPQINREMQIDFEFIAEKAIPILRIGLTTSDGLKLVSSDVLERYHNIQPRQSFTKSVIVEPTEENEFYLNMYVVTESGDAKLAKLIKIPIAIGDFALKNTKAPER